MMKIDHERLIKSGRTANSLLSSSVRVHIMLLIVNTFNNCWPLGVRIVLTMLLYNLKKILFLFLLVGQYCTDGLNQCSASLQHHFTTLNLLIVHQALIKSMFVAQLLASYFKKFCYILSAYIDRYKVTQLFVSHMLCVQLNMSGRIVFSRFFQRCHHRGLHISGYQWIKKMPDRSERSVAHSSTRGGLRNSSQLL